MRTDWIQWVGGVVLACLCAHTHAEPFDPVDLADASLQTRTFETDDPNELLRAALAVIQDLKFFVTDAGDQPGLITATTTRCLCRGAGSLTVTTTVAGPHTVRVRVTLAEPERDMSRRRTGTDDSLFYQNFFSHLSRAQTRQEHTP
jgi:hypothetical protein